MSNSEVCSKEAAVESGRDQTWLDVSGRGPGHVPYLTKLIYWIGSGSHPPHQLVNFLLTITNWNIKLAIMGGELAF